MKGFAIHPNATAVVKKCNMTCVNKGVCRKGKGLYGFATTIAEEDPNPIAHQARAFDMYCDCPTGYTGFNCEIKMVLCPKGKTTCANGAQCISDYDDRGNTYHHCGCDPKHSNLSASYAAQFCQQASRTIFCGAGSSFCTNGGTCLVSSQTSSIQSQASGLKGAQCRCLPGWEGPHCEFPSGTISRSSSNSAEPISPSGITAIAFAGLALLVFLVAGGYGIHRMYRRRASPPTKTAAGMTLDADGTETLPQPPAFLSSSAMKTNVHDIHAFDEDDVSTCSSRQSRKPHKSTRPSEIV